MMPPETTGSPTVASAQPDVFVSVSSLLQQLYTFAQSEHGSNLVTSLTGILSLLALTVAALTLRASNKIHAERALFDFLAELHDSSAELNCVLALDPSRFANWEMEDRAAAEKIAFAFFHLGALVTDNVLQKRICRHYYFAIPEVLTRVEPLIAEWREQRHPYYLQKYLDLVKITHRTNLGTVFERPVPAALERLEALAKRLSRAGHLKRNDLLPQDEVMSREVPQKSPDQRVG